MEQKTKVTTRRKFFLWGLGIAGSITALKFMMTGKKKSMIKMLDENGKLVEVDPSHIQYTGEKISEKEIHGWVKSKPTIQ